MVLFLNINVDAKINIVPYNIFRYLVFTFLLRRQDSPK